MIHKLMSKRETKQQILKVQPVRKLMINIKEKLSSLLEKDAWNLWRWKINDKICGDDVDLVEEAETRSSTGSVNGDGDSFSVFDAFTCPGDNVYEIFENEDKIITDGSIFWVNTNNLFWEGRVIKITYRELPQDSNYLKMIWIHTKKEDRFLIKNCSREFKNNNSYIKS